MVDWPITSFKFHEIIKLRHHKMIKSLTTIYFALQCHCQQPFISTSSAPQGSGPLLPLNSMKLSSCSILKWYESLTTINCVLQRHCQQPFISTTSWAPQGLTQPDISHQLNPSPIFVSLGWQKFLIDRGKRVKKGIISTRLKCLRITVLI